MNLGTPNIPLLTAIPENSASMLPMLAARRAIIIKKVILIPTFSRIRSASPFPDTIPIRTPISWIIANAMIMGMNSHNKSYPNCEPARE